MLLLSQDKCQSGFRKYAVLTCFVLLLFLKAAVSYGQVIPTKGKDFWLGFTYSWGNSGTGLRFDVFITSDVNTSGVISAPLSGFTQNFTVTANQTTTITLPVALLEHLTSEIIETKGIRIQTLDTVSVFALSFQQFSADASQIFPVNSLGTRYRVSSYQGINSGNDLKSNFLIVGTENGTQIKITPTCNTQGGKLAGIPFYVNINQGESYQVIANSWSDDLTGTLIEASDSSGSCRPFAVFSGTSCANIPSGCAACDILYEQSLPLSVWGKTYYAAPFDFATSYTLRIMADQNNTIYTINGGPPAVLNAGGFNEINSLTSASCIQGNKPFSVIQYMEGVSCAGAGDPSMVNLNSEEQKINNVTFSTVTSTVINQHNANVIINSAFTNQLTLDGIAVPASAFTPFSTCPNYSYAQLSLTQGSHTLKADSGFTAYIYGTGSAESYAYSAGSFSPETAIEVDSIICSSDTVVLNSLYNLSNAWWSLLSNPADTLGIGNTLTLTAPIIPGIYLVQGSEFISNCNKSFYYNVEIPSPPVISATQSADTVCVFTPVQLNVNVSPPASYIYSWTPSGGLNNPSIPNPVVSPSSSGWYNVSVSKQGSCSPPVYDSVYIFVQGGNVLHQTLSVSDQNICTDETVNLSFILSTISKKDDFDPSVDTTVWSSISGASAGNFCGSSTGNALYFFNAGIRAATSKSVNTSSGGNIRFDLKIASGVGPCDDTEPGDDIVLEYSVNNGISWVNMATYYEFLFPVFTTINIVIPSGAFSTATQFRWRQLQNSGLNTDNWVIDNLFIGLNNSGNYIYNWSPSGSLSNSTIYNPVGEPLNTTSYAVIAIDTSSGCSYSDSVLIQVDQNFQLTSTADTVLCTPGNLSLFASPNVTANYSWHWQPLNSVTSHNTDTTSSNITQSTFFTVEVTSSNGCIQRDTVNVTLRSLDINLNPHLVANICSNDTISPVAELYKTCGVNGSTCTSPTSYRITTQIINSTSNLISPFTGSWKSGKKQYLIRASELYAAGFNQPGTIKSISFFVFGSGISYSGFTIKAGCTSQNSLTTAFVNGLPTVFTPKQITVSNGTNTFNFDMPYDWDGVSNLVFEICYNNSINSFNSSVYYSFTTGNTVISDYNNLGACAEDSGAVSSSRPDIALGICTQTQVTNLSYLWSPNINISNDTIPSPTITPGGDIVYTVVITDNQSGCLYTDSIEFSSIKYVPPLFIGNDTTLCTGTPITLSAGNWASYLWSTLDTVATITAFTAGNFSIIVTDTNGCSNTDQLTLTYVSPAVINLGNDTTICPNVILTLDADNPGSVYTWSNGSIQQTININFPDTFSVTVDNNYCVNADTIIVTNYPEALVDLGNDTTICSGSSIALFGGSFSQYLWSNLSTDITDTINQPGEYWLLATDANGCTDTDSIIIDTLSIPYLFLGTDSNLCDYNSILLDAGNTGSQIMWNNGIQLQQFTVDTSGIYIATVTDINGCSNSDTITITVRNPPLVNLGNDTVLCTGDTLNLNAGNNGIAYLWSDGATAMQHTITLTNNYIITVTNQYYCVSNDSIFVYFKELPDISITNDTSMCSGDSILLVVNSLEAVDWSWQPNNNLSNPNGSTTWCTLVNPQQYIITVTDTVGCSASDSISIGVNFLPTFSLTNDTSFCYNSQIEWIVPNTYNCIWSNGSTSNNFIANLPGTYWVDVSNNCGTVRDTLLISTVYSIPSIELGPDGEKCIVPDIILDAGNTGASYIWNTGQTSQNILVDTAGLYSVVITDSNGCTNADSVFIQPVTEISFATANELYICPGTPIALHATSSFANYLWSNGSTDSVFIIDNPGIYWYLISNACGNRSDTIQVNYSDCFCKIYAPSAFTPDNDGINELFLPKTECDITSYHLIIFNRWGQVVFETNNLQQGWDGSLKGKPAQENLYYFEINYKGSFHGEETRQIMSGPITLIR